MYTVHTLSLTEFILYCLMCRVERKTDVCVQIYIHNVSCGSRKVRVLRPFVALGFMMMSLLCCLARYGLHHNHWPDVVVGFVIGLLLALYIVSLLSFHLRLSLCVCVFVRVPLCLFSVAASNAEDADYCN